MQLRVSGRFPPVAAVERHRRRCPHHRLRFCLRCSFTRTEPQIKAVEDKEWSVNVQASLLSSPLVESRLDVDILDAVWHHIQCSTQLNQQRPQLTHEDTKAAQQDLTLDGQKHKTMEGLEDNSQAFLKACIERERTDLVLAYFGCFPEDRIHLHIVLQLLLRLGHHQTVCRLIEQQLQLGVIDAYVYNAQISALSKLGRLKQAREVFDSAIACGNGSIHVYNTMLDAYARVGDLPQSEEIWSAICESGLQPDAVSYVGMLRAYGNNGKLDKVRRLFTEMEEKHLKPMPHAYTILYDSIRKISIDVDVRWLMTVVQGMEKAGIVMNRHILGAFISATAQLKLKEEQIDFVFAQVEALRKRTTLGNNVYTTLLQFCISQEIPERSIDIWSMIQSDNVLPNGHVYSSLLKACAVMKHDRRLKFVSGISERIRSDWIENRKTDIDEASMIGAFNSLMHYHSGRKHPEEALAVYDFMQHHGPSPDRISYNIILSALTKSTRHVQVQSILENMTQNSYTPDVTTYGILLNGCSNSKDVDGAIILMREMQEAGMKPTVECYTSLMDTCIKEGSERSLARAFEIFRKMKKAKCKPTAVTYGCLLMAHRKQDDVEGAFRLYQEACRSGISPSDKCHNVLIDMCTEVGRLDDALELIKVLVRKHGDIAEDTMNSIIRALSVDYLPRSLVLMRMMDNRAISPSLETFRCLILACCRNSEIQTAFSLYREMIHRRLPVNREVGSALIQSLSQAGEVMAALRVTNYLFDKAGLTSIDSASINKTGRRYPHPRAFNRKDRVIFTALPNVLSLGWLIVALTQRNQLKVAIYVFRQMCMIERPSGMLFLAKNLKQVFEILMELGCKEERVDVATEVFLEWHKVMKRNGGRSTGNKEK